MNGKRIVALFLTVILLCFSTVSYANTTYLNAIDMTDGEKVSDFYDSVLDYIVKNYKYDITKEELLSSAVKSLLKEHPELFSELGKGAFSALDENSAFYTDEEYTDLYSDVSGVYVGVGILVHQEGTKVVLGEPIENSPAMYSGLKVGDIVISVNGEDVTGYALDKVTSLIKGPAGTEVEIEVLRGGNRYVYKMNRSEIKINPITYYLIENENIGYVKISTFNSNTSDEFAKAMKYFEETGVDNVILDLRNNLGGYLTAAVNVASYFIPDGELVVTEEFKNSDKNKNHYAKKTDKKFKAVVLINEYSASASEVVSCALRDYNSGVLVGKRSYGKGTVQTTTRIRSLDVLWMTVAKYYTKSHTEIHKEGLEPDYIVANSSANFDMKNVPSYDITRIIKEGDSGDEVTAIKKRLSYLGYYLSDGNVFDENTKLAVTDFQERSGLFPYGEADITTQVKLNDVLRDTVVTVDNQYNKAVEIAKELK